MYSFPTRLGTPGIGITGWHQVAGLLEAGDEVVVSCGSLERALPGDPQVLQSMRMGGRRIPYRALGFVRALAWHDVRTAVALRRHRRGLDVLHCWPLGSRRSLEMARRLRVPAVLERPNAHTAFAFETVARERRRLGLDERGDGPHAADPARLRREEAEYALATALLCPSDFVASTFRDRGFPDARLLRTRYGFDPARFSPADGPPPEPFTAVFVGRGEPRKGLHHALEAWRASELGRRGCRFLICGAIDDDYREILSDLLLERGIDELGHVSDPAAVMRRAHALVLPSLEEGSALVTYEARACGCVLVVSDHSGAWCEHGVDALVHPAGDAGGLAAHLTRLAAAPAERNRLRAAGLRRLDSLDWHSATERLREAYVEAARLGF
jgi:glycosyltransferase involved in cell wall biosynthesis